MSAVTDELARGVVPVGGAGAEVRDADGRRRWDFDLGAGTILQGHAHPAVVRAIAAQAAAGCEAAPATADADAVVEELSRRFGLAQWRFTNSGGSEATLDAVRLARAATGRTGVVKALGAYHGHHDAVMVSVRVAEGDPALRAPWPSRSYGAGIPDSAVGSTAVVPFNDASALERRLAEDPPPACVLLEPAMTSAGLVAPRPGYLEQVRELTRRHGVVLIFDEAKTGLAIAAGGGTQRFGVVPDLVTIAKTLAGGLPAGAIGGRAELMSLLDDGTVRRVGARTGAPLAMAAARACLTDVLTDAAHRRLDALGQRLASGCERIVAAHGLHATVTGLGAKGSLTFARGPVTDYTSYVEGHDAAIARRAWAHAADRGFLLSRPALGWTLSVAHTDEHVDGLLAVLDAFARELTS